MDSLDVTARSAGLRCPPNIQCAFVSAPQSVSFALSVGREFDLANIFVESNLHIVQFLVAIQRFLASTLL